MYINGVEFGLYNINDYCTPEYDRAPYVIIELIFHAETINDKKKFLKYSSVGWSIPYDIMKGENPVIAFKTKLRTVIQLEVCELNLQKYIKLFHSAIFIYCIQDFYFFQ